MHRSIWRITTLTAAAAFSLGVVTASAQTTTGTTTTQTTTTAPADNTTTADAGRATAQTTQTTTGTVHNNGNGSYTPRSEWVASGFVGSDFARQADNSMNFGGSLGYLWNSWIGAEFLAGFAPDFRFENNALFGAERPQVNSYMVNIIGAAPVGVEGHFQPFVSAGIGAMTLGSDQFNTLGTDEFGNQVQNTLQPDDARFGGNLGAGFMAFGGNWGFRGDVRYFRAFDDASIASTGNAAQDALNHVLPGLDFWRANIGLALRW